VLQPFLSHLFFLTRSSTGSRHGDGGLDLEGWPHDRFRQVCSLNCCSSLGFSRWQLSKFSLAHSRQLCILAGCDYLDSAPGVGLKTAYKLLKKHGDAAKVGFTHERCSSLFFIEPLRNNGSRHSHERPGRSSKPCAAKAPRSRPSTTPSSKRCGLPSDDSNVCHIALMSLSLPTH
jgi:hypothetical protein